MIQRKKSDVKYDHSFRSHCSLCWVHLHAKSHFASTPVGEMCRHIFQSPCVVEHGHAVILQIFEGDDVAVVASFIDFIRFSVHCLAFSCSKKVRMPSRLSQGTPFLECWVWKNCQD